MPPRRVFLLLYFLSGATGLLYQVVWSRTLTLEIGQTAAAVSTVLAAFMGGLAAGASLGGWRAARVSGPSALRWYAALEAGVALAALLVPAALGVASPVLGAAYRDGAGGTLFSLLRLVVSLAVVAVPATAMGATLPFAVRWLETTAPASAGRLAGRLYAVNTIGAALGASVTGFLLLPRLGLLETTLVGVGTNALVAAAAWRMSRGSAAPDSSAVPTVAAARAAKRRGDRPPLVDGPCPRAAAVALAASGFAALVHEVAWTRALTLVIGPTTYAFTLVLTAFIVGIGAGSAAGTWALRRSVRPLWLLAWAQCAAAVSAFGAVAAMPRLPMVVASLVGLPDQRYSAVLLSEATLVFLLLLPLTLALGASFPLAVAAADTRLESAARPASRLFTSNTVGAIAGAIVGGFVLLPAIGLRGTLLAAAGLGLAVAAGLAAPQPSWRMGRAALVVTAAAAGAAAWWLPRWNPSLLAAGLYRQAPEPGFDAEIEVGAGSLLYYDDGPTGTVSVRRVAGEIALAINGKVDASNAGDMLTQKLLAHLPLLLHPAPLDVAIIGLGSGVTAGAALAHPVTSVDSIELSPQVVRASRFFDADSHRPLDDPRSRLIVGDGRTHLRYSRRQYDVIISEPSNPWMAGVAPLFTREVFVSARDRLRPDGIFCQWAHTYQMSRDDLASIVATFLAAFPDGSLWLVGDADVLLIGTRDGRSGERIQSLSARWRATPDARGDLERVEVRDVESLLALHVAGGRGLAAFARGARVQTDDATALEFSAPLALYERPGLALIARLRALAPEWPHPPIVATALASTDALVWRNRAAMYLAAEAYGPALDSASRALELDPDSEAVDILVKAAAPLGRSDDVTARLIGLTRQHPDAIRPRLALSRLLATRGDLEGAVQTVGAALEHHHESAAAWAQLASVLADLGDAERLTQAVAEIERRAPGSWEALYYAATAAFLTGDLSRAVELGDRASSLSRDGDGRAFNLVGAAQATAGNGEAARRAFEASLGRDPRDPATYVNLARLELESGNPRRASALFSEALVLDPLSSHARQGLAAVRLGSR